MGAGFWDDQQGAQAVINESKCTERYGWKVPSTR